MQMVKSLWPAWLSGLLLVLCYTPFGVWWLGYISLVPLWLAVRHAGIRRTIALCASTGVIYGTAVYNSTLAFSIWFYLSLLFAFCCCLLLWVAVSRHLLSMVPGSWAAMFLPPLVWVGMEALITNSAFGIPFNLGTIQAGVPTQIQSAAFFGIYAVSFLIVLANCAISEVAGLVTAGKGPVWPRVLPVLAALSVLLVNAGYGYRQLHVSETRDGMIRVAAVQPVISTDMYSNGWRIPENRIYMRNVMDRLTREALSSGPQMVFWAEGGNGYYNLRVRTLRNSLYRQARDHHVDLVVSSNDIDNDGNRYNSIFTISNRGELLDRYDKVRLVPFAESAYKAGSDLHPLRSTHAMLGAMVCFESTLPDYARKLTVQGAQLLYIATSDAAFKRSSLVFGHMQLDIFRAVENGRWLVRAANTGPSMIVSPRGEIVRQSDFYRPGVIVGNVIPKTSLTFYTAAGYLVPWIFALLTVLAAIHALLGSFGVGKSQRSHLKRRHKAATLDPEAVIRRGIKSAGPVAALASVHFLLIGAVIMASIGRVYTRYPADVPYLAVMRDFLTRPMPASERVSERFMQAADNTCGAAALAYLMSYYGHEIDEQYLLRRVTLLPAGISMLDLKFAAEAEGFDADGFDINYNALLVEPMPVIAHINDDHYVVINRATDYDVFMFDPTLGNIRVSRDVFNRTWRGLVLQVRVRAIATGLDANTVGSKL